MGILKMGNTEICCKEVNITGNTIELDGQHILDVSYSKQPIQIYGKECSIKEVYSSSDVLVDGSVDYASAYKNAVIWGKVYTYMFSGSRFFNSTATSIIREKKSAFTKKSRFGKRVRLGLTGEFDCIRFNDVSYTPYEVVIRGTINKLCCNGSFYVKGKVKSCKCKENLYVSK